MVRRHGQRASASASQNTTVWSHEHVRRRRLSQLHTKCIHMERDSVIVLRAKGWARPSQSRYNCSDLRPERGWR